MLLPMRLSPSASLLLCVCALLAIVACGPNRRTRTLQATVTAINAARDGFVAWDLAHQKELVAKASHRAEALALVEEYRASREFVVVAFGAAYRAVAIAATQGDEQSLKDALKTADELRVVLGKLTGGR
jgi:hypothetical protein